MRQNENEVKQKSELPAHEVSFVRLRKRVNILASNSPVAIFAPSRTFGIGKSGKVFKSLNYRSNVLDLNFQNADTVKLFTGNDFNKFYRKSDRKSSTLNR